MKGLLPDPSEMKTKSKYVRLKIRKFRKDPTMEKDITALEESTETLLKKLQENKHTTEEEAKPTGEQAAIPGRMLEFPLFDGTDSPTWILKMERLFQYHAMDDFARTIDIIALCMSGQALPWFRSLQNRNHLPKSWGEFRRALFERFEGGDTMYERFTALQQDGTVREYCSQFELYGSLLPDIPDSILEAKFMNGLDALIRAEVRVFRPKDILEIMETARLVEDKNAAAMNPAVGGTSWTTMKLRATINGRAVVVKVDSGATDNFISRKLAMELKLPVDNCGTGNFVFGSGETIFRGVPLKIHDTTFSVDCSPVKIEGNFEVILGKSWLRPMQVDWKARTMKMDLGERTVTFQGDPSL